MLLDGRTGTVLTGSGDAASIVGQPISIGNLDQVRAHRTGWVTTTLRGGQTRLRAPAAIDGTPWFVAVDLPEQAIFGPTDAEATKRVAAALAVGALTFAGLLVLWWRLATRVGSLQRAATNWAAGDWRYRSGLHGSDEFGQVAASFDMMAQERLTAELARTRAEADARDLAGRLTAVLRAATEFAIIGVDLQGKITFFNQGAERMLGYTAEEMTGESPLKFHDLEEIRTRAEESGSPGTRCSLGQPGQAPPTHTSGRTYVAMGLA